MRHVDLEQIAGVEDLAGVQHLANGGQHHSGDGDDGAFLAAALRNPLILDTVVCRLLGFYSGMSGLNKDGLSVKESKTGPPRKQGKEALLEAAQGKGGKHYDAMDSP